MAGKKELLKTFYFRNEKSKQFVESCIKDVSEVENRSASAIIEQYILDHLLPQHVFAKSLIMQIYQEQNGGIRNVLAGFFQINAAGTEPWRAKYANLQPLVEFCLRHVDGEATCKGTEPAIYHFRSQMSALLAHIDKYVASVCDPFEHDLAAGKAAYFRSLYERAEKEADTLVFAEVFSALLEWWTVVGEWSITSRALYDLMVMLPQNALKDDAYTRTELRKLLIEISCAWEA